MNIEPSYHSLSILTKIANSLIGKENISTVIEFGSRYGEDTIEFAKTYPLSKIFAFECNPNTIEACRENLSDYSNVILTEKAVSDTDGEISFFKIDKDKTVTTWEDGNQGASSLLEASGKYPIENYVQEEIKVPCIKLSTFMEQKKIGTVELMWIDIQGAELYALRGLENRISDIKIVHLEVEFFEIYKHQPLFSQIKSFFSSQDFAFLGLTSQGEYSSDAIFCNKKYFSPAQINTIKKEHQLSHKAGLSVFDRIKRKISKLLLR